MLKNPKHAANSLMDWYHVHKRDLPFRGIDNPYFTWVSEIMLQQTQVDTAVPYFTRFIKRFDTVCELANASEDEVLKYWEGLGYYRRAKHLHESAKRICFEMDGVFPRDLKTIESLKGVGRYIARAIHSIAFNQPSAAVDGNVLRVISRLTGYDQDLMKPANARVVEGVAQSMIEHATPRDFTQALMELGATVCQKSPKCEACPMQSMCVAYQTNTQGELPVMLKNTKKTEKTYHVFVTTHENKVFLVKRPDKGLLANLYTFPQYEGDLKSALNAFESEFKLNVMAHDEALKLDHIFSHQVWHLVVHRVELKDNSALSFVSLTDFPYAIAKAHLKIIDQLKVI